MVINLYDNLFSVVVPLPRAGSYALLTRPPLETLVPVRLACVKHATNIHPEPGSNSPRDSVCSIVPFLEDSNLIFSSIIFFEYYRISTAMYTIEILFDFFINIHENLQLEYY
ncbi:hypothetical protein Pint_36379 [Pistacia integerrima]|uniref:Uncharacterized protein n=1 Tax=Pistacia integerrima TaxID=434235 RepID=A0ACC0Y0D4_9ROSI|nr:hypothetical protein Pint_36379 [Pistacia integerrima]